MGRGAKGQGGKEARGQEKILPALLPSSPLASYGFLAKRIPNSGGIKDEGKFYRYFKRRR